jgi:putative hydrolase of the HAD superfamily
VSKTDIKLVIFDVDGTLYRSREYEEHLLGKMVETLAEMMGVDPQTAAKRLAEGKKITRTVSGTVEMLGLDRRDFYMKLAEKVDVGRYVKADSRVAAFLRGLRQRGVRVVLHTNSGRDLATKVLNALGVDSSSYDMLVTSDDAPPKPSIEGYMYILNCFRVEPSQSLYVGDRYEVELEPAKRVGMKTALIHGGEARAGVDYRLGSIFDLDGLLM